jgi:hypothetical protein
VKDVYELIRACTSLYSTGGIFTYQLLNHVLSKTLKRQRQLKERLGQRIRLRGGDVFRLLLLSSLFGFGRHLSNLDGLLNRKFLLLLVGLEAASDIPQPRLVGALGGELGSKFDGGGGYLRSAYVMLVFLSPSLRCLTLDCALHLLDPLVSFIDHHLALSVPLFLQLVKGASGDDLSELEDLSEACLDNLLLSVFPGGLGSVEQPLDVAPDLAHSHRLLGHFAVDDTAALRKDVGDLAHRSHETRGLGRMKVGVLGGFGRTTLQVRHLVGSAKDGRKELK